MFREAVRKNPGSAEAHGHLALVLEQKEQLQEARELLERSLSLAESQPVVTILGSVLRRLGSSEEQNGFFASL